MQQEIVWSSQQPLHRIEELTDEDIDIEFTDSEPDSDYSETESDKDFIVPDDILIAVGNGEDGDPNYEPSDKEYFSNDSSTCIPVSTFQVYERYSYTD